MSWLDDLIGYAPEPYDTSSYQGGLGGLSYLPNLLPDFSQIGAGVAKLQNPQISDISGLMDIYRGAMAPLGVPKQAIDLAAGSLMDLAPAQFEATLPGNEAGQLVWNALRNEPNIAGLRAGAGLVGAEPFINALGRGAAGMITDPSMYLLPSEAGVVFAPGMAEQVYGGLKQGGPEGYAQALLGGLGLGAMGAGHLPEGGIKLPKVEDLTAKLPLQYEPATLGVGLGGLGEARPRPEPTDFRPLHERLGLPEGYVKEPTSADLDFSVLNKEEAPVERFRGSSDEPLSPIGEQQIGTVGNDLAAKGGLDKLYAGADLQRTRKTGELIADASNIKPTDSGETFHAWSLGEFEGAPIGESAIKSINDYVQNRPDEAIPGAGPNSTKPGESFNTFKDRLLTGVKDVMNESDQNPDQKIGIVTHVRGLNTIRAWIEQGAKEDHSLDTSLILKKGEHNGPGSVERLARDENGNWKVESIDVKDKAPLEPGIYVIRHGVTDWNAPEEINTAEKIVPESTKAPIPKEELGKIVQDLKAKYGEKAWRKEMTPEERSSFESAQLKAVEAPVEPPKAPTNILPPKIEPPIPPKPEGPAPKELKPLSRFERAAFSSERNIAKASPEIGKAEKAFRLEHEVQSSKATGEITEATKGVSGNSEQRIIRYMDGESIVLKPTELTVANKLRTITDRIAKMAGDEGVLTGYRKNYFTHIAENLGERKAETYYGKEKLGEKPYGPLEKSRTRENLKIVRSFDVLKQYADKATRRIAEAKFLGKDLSKIKATGEPETVKYFENIIKQETGRAKAAGPVSKGLATLRRIAALGDLTFSSVLQAGQGVHTTAYVGFRRAAKAAFEQLRNFKKADLEALKSGALYPAISHEVGAAIGHEGYMHGVPTADRFMRVHASIAGRMLLEDARKGDPYAQRIMRERGVDIKDPNAPALAGKVISDYTQLRSDIAHVPAWFKTDAGKIATQYLNYAYANTKFMANMLKHPWLNKGQIFRFAAIGALAGEGILGFKAAVKSLIPAKGESSDALKRMVDAYTGDEDFDSKTFFEKLNAVTKTKRIPLDHPGWRFIQNLAGIGAGSIFQTLVEKVSSGQYKTIPLGPAGGLAADVAESAYKSATEGSLKPLGRTALSNVPIPFVSGYRLSKYLLPQEKKPFKISSKLSYKKVKL